MFQGTADPLVMMEALEMDDKEQILDQIRKAQHGGMLQLQQQNAQLQQQNAMMQQQIQEMGKNLSQYQDAINQIHQSMQASGSEAPQGAPAPEFDAAALAKSIG